MAIEILGWAEAHAASNADGFTTPQFDTTDANLIAIALGQGEEFDGVITDSKGNEWISTPIRQSGNTSVQWWYAAPAIAGTAHTFQVSGTDNFPDMILVWAKGVRESPDPLVDLSGAAVGFTNNLAPGISTAIDDGSLFLVAKNGHGNVTSVTGGFAIGAEDTNEDFGHGRTAAAWKLQVTAGDENPTITLGSSTPMSVSMVVFAPADDEPPPADVEVTLTPVNIPVALGLLGAEYGLLAAPGSLSVGVTFPTVAVSGGAAGTLAPLTLRVTFPPLTVEGGESGGGGAADAVDQAYYTYQADDGSLWAVKCDKTWGDNPDSGALPFVAGLPVISKRGRHRVRRIELQDFVSGRFTRRICFTNTAAAWTTPAYTTTIPVRGASGVLTVTKVRSTPELFRHGRAIHSLPEVTVP